VNGKAEVRYAVFNWNNEQLSEWMTLEQARQWRTAAQESRRNLDWPSYLNSLSIRAELATRAGRWDPAQ